MRPTSISQNPLNNPLNRVLGTQSSVRILRALALITEDQTVTELCGATGLTNQGVRVGLEKLVIGAIVRPVPDLGMQRYRLADSPLGKQVRKLFCAEFLQSEEILGEITRLLGETPNPIQRTLMDTDTVPGVILLTVVMDRSHVDAAETHLQKGLTELSAKYDMIMEARALTALEADTVREPEVAYDAGPGLGSHQALDARALDRSQRVADLVRRNPDIVTRAAAFVEHQLEGQRGGAASTLKEWATILETYSVPRIAQYLTLTTPRATRLRQSSPFLAVLSADERSRVIDES
ncbi:MAG: hypothetical protein ACI9W4_002525 [Rhodothermales bacterium]|jgi:hypothetical protein